MAHLGYLGVFVAGLLTFASPCVLPLVPVYLSVLAGSSVDDLKAGARTARALWAALAFALGLALVFIGLGLGASLVGGALLEHRLLLLQLGGLIVFLFGLKYLGALRVPWLDHDIRPGLGRWRNDGSLLGAFVFGATFGLGWTPCIGPVLGAVLTYAASSGVTALAGAGYLAAYAAGLVLPLLVTAGLAPLALHWHRRLLPHVHKLEVVTGVLLLAFGLLLITDRLALIVPSAPPIAASSDGAQTAPSGSATAAAGRADSRYLPMQSSGDLSPPATKSAATCVGGKADTCGLTADAGPATAWSPASGREALAGLVGTDGLRLVELISGTCPVCRRMIPVLQAVARDCAGQGVSIIRVDVTSPEGLAAARHLRVRGVPTFVFLDRKGAEVARLVGEQPLAALEQSIAVLTGGRCEGFRALPE